MSRNDDAGGRRPSKSSRSRRGDGRRGGKQSGGGGGGGGGRSRSPGSQRKRAGRTEDDRGDENGRRRLPTNYPALLSLFAGTVAIAYALQFFPGAILLSVVGAYLGQRGLQFANDRRGRPGRALAWWGLSICAVAFLFGLAVAVQAQTILGDPELLRDVLNRVEAAEPTESG